VLWGWASQRLDVDDLPAVERVLESLATTGSDLRARLGELLARVEVDAVSRRGADLLARGRMPLPSGGWPAIPWPAF
jgi:hypothetical protein